MNYTKTGKAFDIVNYCQSKKNQKLCMVNYSKVSTGGNDPKITKAMRYSQYVQTVKPHKREYEYFDHINETILYIETYAGVLNINLEGTDYITQTINFIDGKHITAYSYLEFLKSIFGENVGELLTGIYPIMPLPNSTYLKRQADIIPAKGKVVPHLRQYNFIYKR
jgi:hypothetical protein